MELHRLLYYIIKKPFVDGHFLLQRDLVELFLDETVLFVSEGCFMVQKTDIYIL